MSEYAKNPDPLDALLLRHRDTRPTHCKLHVPALALRCSDSAVTAVGVLVVVRRRRHLIQEHDAVRAPVLKGVVPVRQVSLWKAQNIHTEIANVH